MQSVFIFIFVFLIVCWCPKCLTKIQDHYMQIFYYFTLTEFIRRMSVKFSCYCPVHLCRQIFTKLTPMVHYGTEMNTLIYDVKRSKFKVTVE